MMRQPEQRIISGFTYGLLGWPQSYGATRTASVLDYAEVTQGCTVRMLTHTSKVDGYCGDISPPLTQDDVELAKSRLQKFAFVGLTEEWDLSICLFRAMFGGLCYGADFDNIRPGRGASY